MRNSPYYVRLAGLLVTAVVVGMLFGFTSWGELQPALELSILILAVVVMTAASPPQPADDWPIMRPSFVVDATTVLLLGPRAALIVVIAGSVAASLRDFPGWPAVRRTILHAVIALAAIQSGALAYQRLGGTLGEFMWPWQAVPIAALVLGYILVTGMSHDVIVPLARRRPIDRFSPTRLLRGASNHLVGVSLAVGVAALAAARMWELALIAAVPLFLAWRGYCGYLNRIEEERRRREVIESLAEGVCGIDSAGRVTLWNDALERMAGCARDRILGSSLVGVVPQLGKTALPGAIAEALSSRTSRTAQLGIEEGPEARVLQVDVLPVEDGVTLVWHDITERSRTEQALRRGEDRLALAAEGANDGLWEWDVRTQELYVSARWRTIIGLSPTAGVVRDQEWFDRVHPDDLPLLKAAIEEHLSGTTDYVSHEHRIRHENGSYRRVLCRGVARVAGSRRPVRVAGSLTDTTEAADAREKMRSAGSLDPLTGLCNRSVFVEQVGRQLEDPRQRHRGEQFAVLYLDLDRFKVVNDSLGHLGGDELLTEVSRRLEVCLRPGDTIARLGGDEFAILLNGLGDPAQANAIAFRIQGALGTPFFIGGREVFTSASIGIAFGPAQYTNPDEIMRDADTAMYSAKSHGKARHELFDADMHARARDRLALENDLRRAVVNNDFEVNYQPIVLLASGMCVGFESLIRWTRNGRPVSPAVFIPIAEELGLIEAVGSWVLNQACQTFSEWKRRFPSAALDCITVNVSSRQLAQQNFLRLVELAVEKAKLRPQDVRLEITETALMDNHADAAKLLSELRDFGVKIYLDDFGTGYSSIRHLHVLPVDTLKIDQSFVKSLLLPDHRATVESILALAHTLKTSVVAEGVETEGQARELERLGCTHAQGYLFSRPLSVQAVETILVACRPLGPKQDVAAPVVSEEPVPLAPVQLPPLKM
jgi:diguanylate cyclase (GGDEF)-like protein/PAS domain S-box-containing protein